MTKWQKVKLGDYITQVRGVSYTPSDVTDNECKGYLPILRANNIYENSLVMSDLVYVKHNKIADIQCLKRGDILVCASSGSKSLVGKAAQAKESYRCSFGAFCKVVRPGEKISAAYLGAYFCSPTYRRIISHLSAGANINNIKSEHIDNLQIPLPPIEEQERIAKELDAVADLLEKQKQLLSEQDMLIKSIFYDMFGDPISNDKGWKIEKLKDLGYLARGKSKHRPRNAPELLGGKYPLIQTGDIAQADLYIDKYIQTYSELGLAQSKMWDKGTLCITIAANIAKTAILKFDACFPDSVVGFVNNAKSHVMFIQIWMSFLQKILEDNAPQAAQKNINLEILENLEVIAPPLQLQQEFADIVESIEQQKQKIKSAITETETLFNALMAKYFDED